MAGAMLACPVLAAANARTSDVPGIDWYSGDVGSAFELAAKQNKLVFLYWGAKWCPPCQQLKSSVFARSDFIAKTHQFVAVYLDGDDPGAQKWGDVFAVGGYPTVVILRADRREVTRLSGGMDLALYADLLDNAESDIRPIADVLSTLKGHPEALSSADCRRLAYYGWELGDYTAEDRKTLGASLGRAAHGCAQLSAVERARLTVTANSMALSPDAVAQIAAIIADPVLGPAVVDALEGLDKEFFAAVLAAGAAVSAPFLSDWERTMDAVANDPKRIEPDQLYATGAKLEVVKQFADPGAIPQPLVIDARRRVDAALSRRSEPYVRTAIVNAVSFIYEELGDEAAEEAVLLTEVQHSKTPYYYMSDLGSMAEKQGHAEAALSWYERAFNESQGEATRFQWGNAYLRALLRLAPNDRERIRTVASTVLQLLDAPGRISARSKKGLERLDAQVRKWNADHAHDQDVKFLQARMQQICSRLPAQDVGLGSCHDFLKGAT